VLRQWKRPFGNTGMFDAEIGADGERRVTGKRRVYTCMYRQAEQKEYIYMQVSNMKYMYGWRIEDRIVYK
jgi:hypothetical protein